MTSQHQTPPTKTKDIEIEKPQASQAHPLIFKQALPVAKNMSVETSTSGASQTTVVTEMSAPGGISLIELMLVLGIIMMLATAAFVIYPQVRNAKNTNDMVAHISAWQNTPVPQDEEFIYHTLANEKGEFNEIQVIAKKPGSYASDLLEASFSRVSPLLEGQSKEDEAKSLKEIGLVPQDKCVIGATLEETSITWEYEKGCSAVPSSLR